MSGTESHKELTDDEIASLPKKLRNIVLEHRRAADANRTGSHTNTPKGGRTIRFIDTRKTGRKS